MNILGDFINRVKSLYPEEIDNEELNALMTTIRNQGDEIEMKDKEITRLKTKLEKMEAAEAKAKAAVEKKSCARKPTTKKAVAEKPAKKAPAKKPAAKKAAEENA